VSKLGIPGIYIESVPNIIIGLYLGKYEKLNNNEKTTSI